jgi:hypothetical protein
VDESVACAGFGELSAQRLGLSVDGSSAGQLVVSHLSPGEIAAGPFVRVLDPQGVP